MSSPETMATRVRPLRRKTANTCHWKSRREGERECHKIVTGQPQPCMRAGSASVSARPNPDLEATERASQEAGLTHNLEHPSASLVPSLPLFPSLLPPPSKPTWAASSSSSSISASVAPGLSPPLRDRRCAELVMCSIVLRKKGGALRFPALDDPPELRPVHGIWLSCCRSCSWAGWTEAELKGKGPVSPALYKSLLLE